MGGGKTKKQTNLELMTAISQSDVRDKSGLMAHNNNNELPRWSTSLSNVCVLCGRTKRGKQSRVFFNRSIFRSILEFPCWFTDTQEPKTLIKVTHRHSAPLWVLLFSLLTGRTVTSMHVNPCLSSSCPAFISLGPQQQQQGVSVRRTDALWR